MLPPPYPSKLRPTQHKAGWPIGLLAIMGVISMFGFSCTKKASDNLTSPLVAPIFSPIQPVKLPQTDPLFYIDGQLCAWVRKIYQAPSGDLWFGTNHYGVMRYDGDSLSYFDEAEGLGEGRITGIVADSSGNVWFGTYGGLTKYDGITFTNYGQEDGLPNQDIWSLCFDRKGILWIGTMQGVVKFDGEQFTTFPLPPMPVQDTTPVLSPGRIPYILEDRAGSLWFGTDGLGISIYDGNTFSHIRKSDGLGDNTISSMLEDNSGNIWIGTMNGGVSRYDGDTLINFTQQGIVKGKEVSDFFEDTNGDIWFAVEHVGLYRYDGATFHHLAGKEGPDSEGIISIYRDREARFWFGGWGGLFRYSADTFSSVTKDGPWEIESTTP